MVLGTWWGWGEWSTVALAVGLTFLFGYAFAADTVSISVMRSPTTPSC